MPLHYIYRMARFLLCALLLFLAVPACSPVSSTATLNTTTPVPNITLSPQTFTATPQVTSTLSPGMVILAAPGDADSDQVSSIKATLSSLAATSHLDFQTRPALATGDLSSSSKVVVVFPPDPGLAELTKSYPGTQFVAVGIQGLTPTTNLSLIGPQGFRLDQQAFIAGYLAALLTADYRVGILTLTGSSSSQVEEDAFSNGVRFYCGLCRPTHPPYLDSPQIAEITSQNNQSGWQSAVDTLIQNAVTTVYVSPEVNSADLFTYLVKSNIELIGNQPPPDSIASLWIATILPDPASALSQLWPNLIAGKGGTEVAMPFTLADTSSGLLNQAHQRLVDTTMTDLINGFIEPNSVPRP